MQPISRRDFLHNVGYGALVLPTRQDPALATLVDPHLLPPRQKGKGPFGNVDAQAQAHLTWYNLPGLALGLIRDNKLVYARGYGLQDIQSRKLMSEYSIICPASMSKIFAGAAIFQLAEEHKLSLDDTFVSHVPYFKMADPRYKEITIRQLLCHTSGLPEVTPSDFYASVLNPWFDDESAQRLVRSLDSDIMLNQAPGGPNPAFRYSDVGFDVLAALVQRLTGEYYEDYQRRHILDPLHMYNSTFYLREVKAYDLMAPHIRDTNGNITVWDHYPYTRDMAVCGSLFTNVVDLSHFIQAMINGGWFYSRIMKPETRDLLWTPLYNEPWGWPATGYTAGFFMTQYVRSSGEPVRMILSGGAMIGVNAHFTIFPDQGIAAIVLINFRSSPKDPDYSWSICDRLAIQMLNGDL